MAFTGQSTALKFGFIMDVLLVFLGLISLVSISKYSKREVQGYDYCILFVDVDSGEQPSACTFSSVASGIIVLAAATLTFMDYITWKRSENYKGKRASVAALFLTLIMSLLSFCTAITVVLGIRKACGGDCNKNVPFVKGIYTAISCAALSGLFFAIYGISEYVQYRRRHINGDKW